MEAPDDIDLLRDWVETRRESAFRQLVERHAPLVWGVAVRKTGGTASADDVVQVVFALLAKKAPALVAARSPLAPWLHRCAVYEATSLVRREARHSQRMKHFAQLDPSTPTPDPWAAVGPHLDEALDSLGETDRRVVLLHWFERRTFAEVAVTLGCTPEAAQRRGHRALEKLAAALKKRGAGVPMAVLGAGLTVVLAPPVPAATLASATAAAMRTSASVSTLQSLIHAMASAKVTTVAAFLLAAAVPVSVQWASAPSAEAAPPLTSSSPLPPRPITAGARVPLDLSLLRAALEQLRANPDDYETQLRVRRIIFSLTAAEIAEVQPLLTSGEGLNEVAHAFFARWAELDGPAATEAARATGKRFGYYAIRGAFITWSAADLDTAWAWLEKSVPEPMDRQFLGGEALATQVQMGRDGATIMARADAVEDATWRSQLRYWVMRAWTTEGSLDSILKWALALPESPEREERIAKTIEQIGEARPDALAYVGHIANPARRDEVAHNILWPYLLARNPSYRMQPPDFVDDMANLTTRYSPDLFRDAGDAIARHGAEHAMKKLAQLPPGEARDAFIEGMLRSASSGGAKAMLPAVAMLGEERLVRTGSLSHFTDALTKQDPRAAAEWIASLPEPSTVRKWAGTHFQSITGKSTAESLRSAAR